MLSNNPSLPDKFIIDIDDVEIQENTFVKIDEKDIDKLINDSVVYIATVKLGDEILKQATSEIGDLSAHEGIVIRDTSIHNNPYKITGNLLLKLLGFVISTFLLLI